MTKAKKNAPAQLLEQAREEFITQWGALGSAWGINRTMAQIHALLMTGSEPLCTDDIMAELQISRGNAHTNLRELIGWGLVRSVILKGKRKEYFEAEKEIWKMACTIARERKRREVTPALEVLTSCVEKTEKLKSSEAKVFHSQLSQLRDFLQLADRALEKVAASEESKTMALLLKFLG